jgi:serine/threonine-protein kinase RsbW
MQQETQSDPAGPEPAEGAAAPAGRGPAQAVVLAIPAEREQVVLVRSVAGHIGARLGLSVAQLTDLRLAVDEACGLFLLSPRFDADVLECRFEQEPGTLRVTVSAAVPASLVPDLDDIGWLMLDALVDELSWRVADGTGTVALVTRVAVRGA